MNSTVFEFHAKGLLKVVITGSNEDRYKRYLRRIGAEDNPPKGDVVYSCSMAGIWRINGVDLTADGVERKEVPAMPAFYETRYNAHFFIEDSSVTDCRLEHVMASVSDEFEYMDGRMDGTFDFLNEPGRFTFELLLWRGLNCSRIKFEWQVVSEKIDVQRDAQLIISRLESAKHGFVYSFLTKTKHDGGLSDELNSDDRVWVDVFRSFVNRYLAACEWIVQSPHLKYEERERFLRADRIRRWSPMQANRYGALPDDMKERLLFRTVEIQPETDTVENRFVKFTLGEIAKRLEMFSSVCEATRVRGGKAAVSKAFIESLIGWKGQLDRIKFHPFFRSVGHFKGFRQESLALQRKRGYSKIQETWIALRHAIDVTGRGLDVGNQPIWKLYEFWCFILMHDILADDLKLTFRSGSLGKIGSLDDMLRDEDVDAEVEDETDVTGRHEAGGNVCRYVFEDTLSTPHRIVTLTYQQSYSKEKDGYLSHIVEQIPDIVLTVADATAEGTADPEKTYTYLFDAKYRIYSVPSKKNPQLDAAPYVTLNDMHRYRDAILYRFQTGEKKLSREIVGAYVLYPGRIGKSFDYTTIIESENIGAIPLLPTEYQRDEEGRIKKDPATGASLFNGDDGEALFKNFVKSIFDKKSKPAHLSAAIPPRGASLVMDQDTFVIVGYSGGGDHLRWIERDYWYNLRIGDKVGAVKPEPKLLMARYLLVHCEGELNSANRLFEIDNTAAKFASRGDLVNKMGYPGDTTSARVEERHYLVLKLKALAPDNPLYGKAFDVSMLNGAGSGRQSAIPFVTTEADLVAHIVS